MRQQVRRDAREVLEQVAFGNRRGGIGGRPQDPIGTCDPRHGLAREGIASLARPASVLTFNRMVEGSLDHVYGALADGSRRAIVGRLAAEGELKVTDLARPFDMSLNAV